MILEIANMEEAMKAVAKEASTYYFHHNDLRKSEAYQSVSERENVVIVAKWRCQTMGQYMENCFVRHG